MTIYRMLRNHRGFTLVEILIVALMIGLVLGAVYSLYSANQRTAYVQDKVVDLQQNLRITIESIARDIRNAGFLCSDARFAIKSALHTYDNTPDVINGNTKQPINTAADSSANYAALLPTTADASPGQPARVHADMLILNTASPAATFAKIAENQMGSTGSFDLKVTTAASLDSFNDNELIRIINPTYHKQATASVNPAGTLFKITDIQRDATPPFMTVQFESGADPGLLPDGFKKDFVIAKISNVNPGTYPANITYCLGPANGCAPTVTSCPQEGANDRTLCLIRLENGAADVIASRISGLQFTYLHDDGTESAVVGGATLPDLGAIRAVRITVTGQTASAGALISGGTSTAEKTRVLQNMVRLQNRLIMN